MAVDIAQSDVVVVNMNGDTVKKTCVNSATQSLFPRQVAYVENGRVIVCGRDDGTVDLYRRRDGCLKQRLQHDPNSSAQTVAVSEDLGSTRHR